MADIFEGLDLSPEQQRELMTLRRGFAMLNQVIDDPDVGTPLKRKLKEKNPELNIQVVDDIAEPLLKPIKEQLEALKTDHAEVLKQIDEKKTALDQVVENFNQQRKDEADVTDLTKKIDAAAKHYRFTDEGKAALIEHMRSTGTPDPMTAGAYLIQNMEKPSPVSANGLAPEQARRNGAPDIDIFELATGHDNESLKLLHGSPKDQDRWMMGEIGKIMAESQDAA